MLSLRTENKIFKCLTPKNSSGINYIKCTTDCNYPDFVVFMKSFTIFAVKIY